jgi:hypothetical protein
MSKELTSTPSAMEGQGAYNRHAKLPAGGAALALPLLEKAIQNLKLDLDDRPVIIADYGSSQGKNSLAPMHFAIRNLRSRIGEDRPIVVFHIDQPANDFNSLFDVLATDPERYELLDPNVFPGAIGRSFYEQVLPSNSVHLGWSSYAAVWLSRIPTLIPGHFVSLPSAGAARAEFERQGAQDWERFLSLRSSELLPGGRLVVVLPGVAENGLSGFEAIMDLANTVLAEMTEEGAITPEERARMVLGTYPRRKADLVAPFARNGRFQGLTVEAVDESVLTDPAWTDYERDSDSQALAAKQALFFRSVFMPSLASALTRVRAGDAEALRVFGDRLEDGMKRRLAKQPAAMHSFVQTIVLAKQDEIIS